MISRFRKLNGWQRLWVVVAAGSFICALAYSFVEGSKQARLEYGVLSGFSNSQCRYIIELPPGFKLDQPPTYGDPCWDLYLYRSIYADARDTRDGYIDHMHSIQRTAILHTTIFFLIVWLIAVGLLYGGGVVVAWVIKGFRAEQG
jgi:hypothetical protein